MKNQCQTCLTYNWGYRNARISQGSLFHCLEHLYCQNFSSLYSQSCSSLSYVVYFFYVFGQGFYILVSLFLFSILEARSQVLKPFLITSRSPLVVVSLPLVILHCLEVWWPKQGTVTEVLINSRSIGRFCLCLGVCTCL